LTHLECPTKILIRSKFRDAADPYRMVKSASGYLNPIRR